MRKLKKWSCLLLALLMLPALAACGKKQQPDLSGERRFLWKDRDSLRYLRRQRYGQDRGAPAILLRPRYPLERGQAPVQPCLRTGGLCVDEEPVPVK